MHGLLILMVMEKENILIKIKIIIKFEYNFLYNIPDTTSLDYFDCKINLSLVKTNKTNKLVPYQSKKFIKNIRYFNEYFRIEEQDKMKDSIILRYKKSRQLL